MAGLDKLFRGMRSSSLGLSAERVRMDVIAQNIANANTTKTESGGPYRRQMVRFEPMVQRAADGTIQSMGVRASEVVEDFTTPMESIYDPSNLDAGEDGYVQLPNVSATREMADLITAMRAYEANLSAQENSTQLAERALQLAR
ncbi:MAG: flagellar basal body rod protein FlgC [Planctomycetota bacterium]|nr:flagellar basal body rod protein FlgC [Planctomycetota bacterium]